MLTSLKDLNTWSCHTMEAWNSSASFGTYEACRHRCSICAYSADTSKKPS